MINYYEVCVNVARMINNPKATKNEIQTLAKRMFNYVGKQFEESAFNAAFYQFRRANGTKMFQPIYK